MRGLFSIKQMAFAALVWATLVNAAYAQPKFRDLRLPPITLPALAAVPVMQAAAGRIADVLPPIVNLPLSCYVRGVTCTVVPVTLLDFKATRLNDQTAGLVWHAANEADLTGYYVERSPDGTRTFTDRGFVPFANSGSTLNEYRFNDPNDLTVVSYYRLRINHTDGSFTYSDLRPVMPVKASALMIAYPSPARASVNIRITARKAGNALMIWHDAAGRTVLEKNITISSGTTFLTESITTLAGGSYFISVKQEGSATITAYFFKL